MAIAIAIVEETVLAVETTASARQVRPVGQQALPMKSKYVTFDRNARYEDII